MRQSQQKLKLLHLMQILMEKTDDENTLTVPQMIDELKKVGICAERKSIYDDLEQLRLFGIDICSRKSRTHDYFIGCRDFELPELKLLVDSVQSSKFITRKKSMELIEKIEKLTSNENAKKLHRQVFVTNRVKTPNEKIYYNVDKIYDAIAADKQISFKYFNLDINKNKVYRHNGELYTETPLALTWDDENYYMITYKADCDRFTHYRVDKMEKIEILSSARIMPKQEFDVSIYAKQVFGMFGGEETDVTLRTENELAGVIFDRFGTDVTIIKDGDTHFKCKVRVAVSPQFLSWIMSFGSRVKIESPKSVIDSLCELADSTRNLYK